MSYAPTAEELKQWSKGPTMESLFGKNFPLSRDHPDWQKLEQGTLNNFDISGNEFPTQISQKMINGLRKIGTSTTRS